MTKEEILQLGRLSRIALTTSEVDAFQTSIDSILEYVSVVKTMAGTAAAATDIPQVGARYNVLRPDVVTELPGSHAETLLASMPKRDGRYLSVMKILHQPE